MIPKPMKGVEIPLDLLEETLYRLIKRDGYVYASIKHDGYRCRTYNGLPYSSTGKLIPCRAIREAFKKAALPDFLDGELIIDPFNFQTTQSGVTTHSYTGPFEYWVFDCIAKKPFSERWCDYSNICYEYSPVRWINSVEQQVCSSVQEVLAFEKCVTEAGHEGVMIRSPLAPYKEGECSLADGWLLKLVRFHTAEAIITGTYERCSSEGAEVPLGMLGGFYVRGSVNGILTDFKIGNGEGWTIKWRQKVWRESCGLGLIGKEISYKYKIVGMDKKPRSPIAKGIL